jgi:sec-independent protein translocase protein TatA
MSPLFAFFGGLGWGEILIIMIVGVLLFGRKLPEVGRSLGKGIVEFKKGLKGVEDDLDTNYSQAQASAPAPEAPRPPQRIGASAPKFQQPSVDAEAKQG